MTTLGCPNPAYETSLSMTQLSRGTGTSTMIKYLNDFKPLITIRASVNLKLA